MSKTVQHDSRDSKRGDFYQSLVAIKYAIFEEELFNFNKLTIEHEGDVSFDDSLQIETKHHISHKSIADTSEEFWKTFYNWLKQKLKFEKYILHTTCHFSQKGDSLLKKWNTSNLAQRIDLLNKINFGYNLHSISEYQFSGINLEIIENLGVQRSTIDLISKVKGTNLTLNEIAQILSKSKISETETCIITRECKSTSDAKFKIWNYARYIKSYPTDELKLLLSRVTIKTDQENDIEIIKSIAKHPTFRGKCKYENDYNYLIRERIAGAIASKVVGKKRWEITNLQFYNIINDSASDFFKENYRPVFDKYLNIKPEEEDIQSNMKKKFVFELDRISCESDEIKEAIVDYWKTNTLLIEELELNPTFVDDEYNTYKNEIIYPKVVNKKRTYVKTADITKNLKNSQMFYRESRDLNFHDYRSIKSLPYFTHGTLHNIIEDGTNDFKWIIDD